MGRQNFAICLPILPPSPTRDGPGHPADPLGSFQYQIGSTDVGISESGSIYCLARQDVAIGAHTCLAAGTRVLDSVLSLSYIATRRRIHA
jgi:hypothetical protein